MAVIFCEYTDGNDGNTGLNTFANGKITLQAALTAAGAGGVVFVRDRLATKDSATGARTLTSPGTKSNPTLVYGVKAATTNEPPLNSDLAIRGTDTLPIFELTSAGADLSLDAFAHVFGHKFVTLDRFQGSSGDDLEWIMKGCEIEWDGLFFFASDGQTFRGIDCDYQTVAGSQFLPRFGARILLEGGLVSGTAMNFIVDTIPNGVFHWVAGDLSLLSGKTGIDLTSATNTDFWLENCELPASFTLASGTANDRSSRARMTSCSSDSALGSADSVQSDEFESIAGGYVIEQTAVRTGGADDGGEGLYSYAITPNANATLEPYYGIKSPMQKIWENGDGTAKIIEIFFTHETGEADSVEGDVTVRYFTPSSAGTAQHDMNDDDAFTEIIPASPAVLDDDTGSTWGAGTTNDQKMVLALSAANSPDFMGPLFYQLSFNKRYATPKTIYHDPLPVVT